MTAALAWLGGVVFVILLVRRFRRRRHGGSPSTGTGAWLIYDFLHKRAAVEVIVEERAALVDPETADGKGLDLSKSSNQPPTRHNERRMPE